MTGTSRRSGAARRPLGCLALSGLLLAAPAAPAAPAAALGITVDLPSVTVTTPTVELPTPPITVPAPPIEVSPPPIEVSPPPVKAPPVVTEAPTVPTTPPPVPSEAPVVAVKAPSVSPRPPTVPASAPSVTSRPDGATAGAGANPTSPSGAPAPAVAAEGGAVAVAAPLGAYGGGLGAGYGRMPALEAPVGARERARIAARERTLKATVARLRGCLGELPAGQRELLELRTGLTGAKPLSPRAVAARLRIGAPRLARLEAQAVRELSYAASTGGCARLGEAGAGAAGEAGIGLGGQPAGARGGVEAVRYEAAASPARSGRAPSAERGGNGLLGTDIAPVAGGAILLLVAALAAGVAVSAILADAAGQGPRHAEWRQRVINRLSSRR